MMDMVLKNEKKTEGICIIKWWTFTVVILRLQFFLPSETSLSLLPLNVPIFCPLKMTSIFMICEKTNKRKFFTHSRFYRRLFLSLALFAKNTHMHVSSGVCPRMVIFFVPQSPSPLFVGTPLFSYAITTTIVL